VNTDADGVTYWLEPLEAGGFSEALTAVMLNGDNVWYDGLSLSFNSPDITGDGMVTLHDVGTFAQDFFGEYRFRSDLHRDGVLNLADLGALIQGLGGECSR
jgi:hypothetical protein